MLLLQGKNERFSKYIAAIFQDRKGLKKPIFICQPVNPTSLQTQALFKQTPSLNFKLSGKAPSCHTIN